jgi:hypothetical protein
VNTEAVEGLLIQPRRHQHEHALRRLGAAKPARGTDRPGASRFGIRVVAAGIEHEESRTRTARGDPLDQN